MDLSSKLNRASLKSYFEAGDIPTEANFQSLIDGMINHAEDKIAKIGANPVSLEAEGAGETDQDVLDLYRDFSQVSADWSINLNPKRDPAATLRDPGLNIHNANSHTNLYISSGSGNVGIGTTNPEGKLSVAQEGGALKLGSDQNNGSVYLSLYPNGLENDELAFFGYRTANSPTLNIDNEKTNGDIRISTANSIILNAGTGTTIDNNLTVNGNTGSGGFDFQLGFSDQTTRGNSGFSRALVKDVNATLIVNYANDFQGGTIINGGTGGVRLNGNVRIGNHTLNPNNNELRWNGKIFGSVINQSGQGLRIASGRTQVADWKNYSTTGIYVDVNTSAAGFTQTPVYFTSLQGTSAHWEMVGATSIYSPTRNSFRVYMRSARDASNIRITTASTYNWYLSWIAIGI